MPNKVYKVGEDTFEIEDKDAEAFLSDFPDALELESFKVGEDTFDIAPNDVEIFMSDFPDAQPLKKKDEIGAEGLESLEPISESPSLQLDDKTADNPDYIEKARNLRKGTRKNPDGSESTVLMSWGEVDGGKFVAHPTLFQNEDGSWYEVDEKDAFQEAKKRGEVFEFDSAEEADKFAGGSWKKSQYESDYEKLFPESDIEQTQKRKEFEIQQDLERPSKEEVRKENIEFQDKLITKGRESLEGLEGLDLLTLSNEDFIKSSGVDDEGLASLGDLSDRREELKSYLNQVKQEEISKAADEKFSIAARMKSQEDDPVQYTPEEMYKNAKDNQFNFSVNHLDENEQKVARDIKELSELYNYIKSPEAANLSLEDKNQYSNRINELKKTVDEFHKDRSTKKLYDPNTGEYIDEVEAKETNNQAALEYQSKYNKAAKELEGSSLEKLEQIHSKEASKLEYLEDIYNKKIEWIPGQEPMTAEEFKALYQEERARLGSIDVGKTGFADVDLSAMDKFKSGLNKLTEIDDQLVNQKARFDAVNEAYLLNTDMATREFGFMERLGSGIVEGTASVFGQDYTLQGTDFETVQNYIKVMDEEGGDVTQAQRDNAAIETMDKVGYAIGSSVPVMAEMAAVSYLTGGAAAELGLVRYGNMVRRMMYSKYGRNGHLAYNFMKENLRQALVFKLSGQGAAQGMGEATAQQVLDIMNPAKRFTGKFAPLKEFLTRTSVGTIGETTGELLGEYVNQLTENGFDTDRAFQDAFGRTPEDIYDNLMVTAITSAMFSGTSNAKVLKGIKNQIDAMPDNDSRKKEYQSRVEEAITSQQEIVEAGTQEEGVKVQETLATEGEPELVEQQEEVKVETEPTTEKEVDEVELFHGTNKDFDTFEMSEEGVIWLTDNSEYAKQQGSKTKSVKISPQNTLTREKLESTSDEDLYKAISSVEEVSKEDFYEGYLPEIKLRLEEGLSSEKVFEGMGEGKILKALGYDVEKVKNPYDKTGEESYFYKVYDENLLNKPKVEDVEVTQEVDQDVDVVKDITTPTDKEVEKQVSEMESKLEEDTKKYEESLRSELKTEETVKEKVVEEEVVEDSPEVKRVKDELEYSEMQIEDLQEEIRSTKQELKEEIFKLREKKAEIRSRKIPRDEKAELLEDVDYEIEELKGENEGLVSALKDEISDHKQDIRDSKRKLSKAQEQTIEDDIEVVDYKDSGTNEDVSSVFYKGNKVAEVEQVDGGVFMVMDRDLNPVKSYKTKSAAIKAAKKLALDVKPEVKAAPKTEAKIDADKEAEIQAKVEEFRKRGKENIQSFISESESKGYKVFEEKKPKKKGKTKLQKQIDADVEGKPQDKATVKETVLLKNRLKEFGKGYRKAKKDFKSFGNDIKEYFKNKEVRGQFNPKQTEMIAREANKVTDAKSYEEFEAYSDKVIEKVNFAEDVSQANSSKKKTKSIIKKSSTPSKVKALGEKLLDIDPKKVDNPSELTALLDEYNEGTSGFGSVEDVNKQIQKLEDQVVKFDDKVVENYLKKSWEESDFKESMTLKDFKEYMELEKASEEINQAIKTEDLGDKPSKTRSMLERVIKWRLSELQEYADKKPDLDSKSKRSIKTFLKIYDGMDIEKFSVAQLREMNNIINEITLFDSFNRTGDLESLIQGNVEGKKLLGKYKGLTQFSALASSKVKNVLSLDNFFKAITSGEIGKNMVADLTKEVSKGNNIATKKSDVFNIAIDQLFKKIKNQEESFVRLGMHSFLSQHEIDLGDVDIDNDLKAKKAQIELQIDKLEQESVNKNRPASTRRGFKKMAENYKKVYEESFKDIKSKKNLDEKLSREEKAVLDFSRNNFEKTKDQLKDNYDRFTGKEFIEIDNYLPLSAKPFKKYGETDLSGFKYDPPSTNVVDKKQSGTTKKRVKLQTKNADGTVKSDQELEQMDANTLYLFNFKDNMKQKYRETLYDIHTLKARKDLDHTINSSYVKELFDAELHKEVVRKISGQVNTQRGSYYDQIKDYSKWAKYPLNALRYVKATKLKTIDQWVKQPISIIAHTSAVYGKSANKAIALSAKIATNPEYREAFNKLISTSDISNRTTEGEYIIKEQNSLVVEALKKFGLEDKGLSKVYIKAVDGALVTADDMATKMSWLASYIHETGGPKDFDLLEAAKNIDQDAIARADSGSADINNVSDFSKSPDLWRDADKTLIRELLFNYKSFSVNMAVRNAIAWRDLLAKPKSELTDNDRNMAARYIVGSVAASIIFQATKATIVHVFWDELTDLIMGVNTDDEDDVMERLKKATAKGTFDYAFGGLPEPAEELMKHFLNWSIKEGKRITTGKKPKKYDDMFYTANNYLPGSYGMPKEIIKQFYEGLMADEITDEEQYKIMAAFSAILGEGNLDRFFNKAISKARKQSKKKDDEFNDREFNEPFDFEEDKIKEEDWE